MLLILQIKFDILFLRCAKIVFFVSISVTNFQQLTFNLGKTDLLYKLLDRSQSKKFVLHKGLLLSCKLFKIL